eukprot:g1651.t1
MGPEMSTKLAEATSHWDDLQTSVFPRSTGIRGEWLPFGCGDHPNGEPGKSKHTAVLIGHQEPADVGEHVPKLVFHGPPDQLPQEPFTVFLDKPVNVMGTPFGQIASYERGDVDVEQWVVLEFTPGNTIMPGQTMSGVIVILPPSSFTIADRLAGRWVCPIADTAPFKDTIYGVRLKVKNPAEPGAARSWRIELWEEDAAKPEMHSELMWLAALSQENQLLGSINTVRFDIIPQQPIGNVPNTRLRVLAPPGFVIIKR